MRWNGRLRHRRGGRHRRVDAGLPAAPEQDVGSDHIVEYESYEKPGQYGDAQQTIFFTDLKVPTPRPSRSSRKGDKVRLEWDRHYTRTRRRA